jgi:hypothetical protein
VKEGVNSNVTGRARIFTLSFTIAFTKFFTGYFTLPVFQLGTPHSPNFECADFADWADHADKNTSAKSASSAKSAITNIGQCAFLRSFFSKASPSRPLYDAELAEWG